MATDWLDISDETPRRAYTATPGQTVFTFPFVFFDEADLQVYVDAVLLTLSADYATSGAQDEDGGAVTLVTPLTGGESVVITRVLAYELTTHIPTSGELDTPAINLQFSRFTAMLQQAVSDLPRALRQPAADATELDELPVAADRSGKYLAFDADGQPFMSAAASGAPTSAFMQTLLDDADAATARTTLGITDQSSYAGLSNWHHCR
jgi:hypothetical protein